MPTPTLNYDALPPHLREGARRWIEHGTPPGDFLRAVIANDLRGAVCRADPESFEALPAICRWFYCEAPSQAHGPDALKAWPEIVRDQSADAA